MRPVSLKRQRRNREAKPVRDAYRTEFPTCQWCQWEPATELHEISRGPARNASLDQRCAWLALCRNCHREIDRLPVAAQLAIKRARDREHYDRRAVNVLRGRAPDAITEQEIDLWAKRLNVCQSPR